MYYYFFFFSTIPGKTTAQEFPQTTMYRAHHTIMYHTNIEPANVRSTHGHTTGLQLHRWHLILRQQAQFALPYQVISRATLITERHRGRQAPVTKTENYRARINTNCQDLHRETGLKMLKCRNRELNETVSRSGCYVLIIERGRGRPMNKSDIIARPAS